MDVDITLNPTVLKALFILGFIFIFVEDKFVRMGVKKGFIGSGFPPELEYEGTALTGGGEEFLSLWGCLRWEGVRGGEEESGHSCRTKEWRGRGRE